MAADFGFLLSSPPLGHARQLGQAVMVYVDPKEIARALAALNFLKDSHADFDALALAYGAWYDSSGIDYFWGLRLDLHEEANLVSVEPAEAWARLQVQAAAAIAAGTAPASPLTPNPPVSSGFPAPNAIPDVNLIPLGPPQDVAPQQAGVLGLGELLLLGTATGFGVWLVARKVF